MLVWSPKSASSGSGTTTPPATGSTPYVGSSNNQGVSANSMTFSVPSGVATGEMMLLIVGCYGTCTTPSGWTLQSAPTEATTRCLYVFSRFRAASDTTVSVTLSASDSHAGTLLGIKGGASVNTSANIKGSVSDGAGTTLPSITTTVAKTLTLWIVYSNSATTNSDSDVIWSPDKPRAAVVIAPASGTYYGALSVASSAQSGAGASEMVKVTAPGATRSLATFVTMAIAP